MAENVNLELARFSILRTVELQSVATWMLRDLIKRLKKAESEILVELMQADPTGTESQAERSSRLKELFAAIEGVLKSAYQEIADRIEENFDDIADATADKQRNQFFALLGVKGRKPAIDLAALSIMGATTADWLARQGGDLNFKTKTALQHGFDANEPLEKLVRRVRGFSSAEKEIIVIARPLDAATKNLETLIRTAIEGVGQEAVKEAMDNLPEKIHAGWQSIAVIDSHTTQICLAYAWKLWTMDLEPVGHSLPFLPVPRHWGCRSSIAPTILDADPSEKFDFDDWMRQIPMDDQDRIFGKTNMLNYRGGKYTAQKLIRMQERSLDIDAYRKERDPRLPPE